MQKKLTILIFALTLFHPFTPAQADGHVVLGLGRLTSMSLSPDETRLAIGTTIGVYFYDAQTFAPQGGWGTGYPVERVIWSPRGDTLAVIHRLGDTSQQMEVRAVTTGAVQWALTETSPSKCSDGYGYHWCRTSSKWRWKWAFSPDGTWLAVARNSAVELRDVSTGALAQSLQSGQTVDYENLVFDSTGQLTVCCANRQIQLWDIVDGQITRAIYGPQGDQLAWSPDDKFLSVGGQVWDVTQLKAVGYHFTNDLIGVLAFSPDNSRLAASDGYGAVRVWSFQKQALRQVLVGHRSFITDLAWAADSQTLYSAGDNAVRVWDTATGQQLRVLEGFSPAVRHIAWSASGRYVFSIEGTQLVKAEVATRLPVAAVSLYPANICYAGYSPEYCYDGKFVTDLTASPVGDVVAVANPRGVVLYDTMALQVLLRLPTGYPVFRLAFSPDGRLLATGGDSPYVVLWEIATGKPQASLLVAPQKTFTVALAFSADGQTLYTFSGDGGLSRWALTTNATAQTQLPETIHGLHLCWYGYSARQAEDFHDGCGYQVGATALNSLAERFASEQLDGTLLVSDLNTGEVLYTLDTSAAATINPQGTRLAAVSGSTIRIWNLATGDLLTEHTDHTDIVDDIAFSPNGAQLLSGSRDGTMRIWSVP